MDKRVCEFCELEVTDEKFYYIYAYVVDTEETVHYMGLLNLLEELADYLMDQPIHLSAGQIIIFRPDIMEQFLAKKFPEEKIVTFYLQKYVICAECYEEYDKKVPLL
jgi:hypothetical protein